MAFCKPDLVAAVLRQLGVDMPDPERLTKAVMDAAAELKQQAGVSIGACLLMTPVDENAYRGSLREKTKYDGGVKV